MCHIFTRLKYTKGRYLRLCKANGLNLLGNVHKLSYLIFIGLKTRLKLRKRKLSDNILLLKGNSIVNNSIGGTKQSDYSVFSLVFIWMEQTIDIIIINLSVYFSFIAFYFSEKILFWRQFFSFHDNEIDRKECDQAFI